MKKDNSNIINVFKFSLVQIVKNKVFIILTVACALLMFVLTPTMIYMSGELSSKDTTSVKKVYVIDENEILNNTKALPKDGEKLEGFGQIKWYVIDEKYEIYKDKFQKNKDNKSSLLIQATVDKGSYLVNIHKQEDCDIKDSDISKFSEQIVEFYNDNKVKNIGLDKKSYNIATTSIETNVKEYKSNNNDKQSEITVISVLMMVIAFFLVLSGENISTQIVTEKSTKLVEYLLVNIRPFDLVCGKILASVVVSFVQMVSMVGSGLCSILLCKKIGIISSFEDTLSLFKINELVGDVSAGDVLLIILFLIAGFLFYAILACMLASTVTRLEDLSNASLIYGVIILIAIYGIMLVHSIGEAGTMINNIMIMLPFTSPFVTPSYILLGKLSVLNYVIAIIIQVICVIVLGLIAAKIYMALIMYSGNKLKLKQVLSIVGKNKAGEIYE